MKSFFQRKQTRAQPSSKSSSDHKFSLPPSQISPETHRQTPAPSTYYDGKQKAYEVPSHSSSNKGTSAYKVAPTQSNGPTVNAPQWIPPPTSLHRRDDERARESRKSDQHRHRHRERSAETDVEKVASRDKERRREHSRHRGAEHDSKSRHYYSETERDLYRKPDKENLLTTQHRDRRRNESSSRRAPYDEGNSSDDSRRKHKSSSHRRHRTTDAVFVSDYDSKYIPFSAPSASSEKPGREDLPVHLPVKSVKMQSLENQGPQGSASETERIKQPETRRRHKDSSTSQLPEHRPSTTATKTHYNTRQPKTGSESRVASSRATDNYPPDRKKSTVASEFMGQSYAPSSGSTGPAPTAYQLPYSHTLQESVPQSGMATSSSMSSYHTTLSMSRQGAQGTPPTTSSESPASMRKNQSSFVSSDPTLHQPVDGRASRNLPVVSLPSAGSQRDAHREHLLSSPDSNTPQPTLNPSSPNKVPSLISKFESLSAAPSAMMTPTSPSRPSSAIGFKQSLDRGIIAPSLSASVSQQKTSQPDAYHRTDAYTSPTQKVSENLSTAGNSSSQRIISYSGYQSTNIIDSKQSIDHEDPATSSQPGHSIPRLNSTDQACIMTSNASQPQILSHEAPAPYTRQTSSATSHSNDGILSPVNDYRTHPASGSSTKREIPHPNPQPWAPNSASEPRDHAEPSNAAPYVSTPFATSGHHVKNQLLASAQSSTGQTNTIQTNHVATSVPKAKGMESKWTSASSTAEAQHHGFSSPYTHTFTPAAPKIIQAQSDTKAHARHDSTSVPTASRSGTESEKAAVNPQRGNSMLEVQQKALFQHPKLAEIMSSGPTATPVPTDNPAALPSGYEGRPSFDQHLASFHISRDGMSPVYSSASKQAAERAELSRLATAAKPPSPALHHKQSKSHWQTPPSPGAAQTPISTPSSRHSPASISRPYDFRTGHGGSPSLHKASSRESYTSARIYTPNADSGSARVQIPEAQIAPIQASPLQPSYYRSQSYESQTAPPAAQTSSSAWKHDESAPRTHRTVSFTSPQSQPQTSRYAKPPDKYVRPDEPIGKTNPQPSTIDLPTSHHPLGTAKHSVSIGSTAVPDIQSRSSRNQSHYRTQQNLHPSPPKLSQKSSEESILLTPSSLAPSMLKPTVSRTSIPVSMSSQNESKKKSGFLGIFKGKQPAAVDPYEIWYPPETNAAPSAGQSDGKLSRVKVPRAIAIPSPNQPISERKSPNKAVFTPFRYLTSRRHRTVSAASVEALNGTAPNTVVGSPTASMHSQNPMQPPLRDPIVATQEWRDEMGSRPGGKKIQRPGVVFDVKEEPSEDKQRLKPVRSRQSGASGLTSRPG